MHPKLRKINKYESYLYTKLTFNKNICLKIDSRERVQKTHWWVTGGFFELVRVWHVIPTGTQRCIDVEDSLILGRYVDQPNSTVLQR